LNILQLINVRWYNACAHYAISLSYALKRRGHKVIVAGDPKSPPLFKAKELGLFSNEDLYLSCTNPWMIVYNIKRMEDLVEKEKIDIINAHRGEGHLIAAMAKSFCKWQVPLIRTRGDVRKPKVNLFARYLNDKLTDKIITTCQVLKESYIKNLNMSEDKAIDIPVGIDHDFFSPREGNRIWKEKLSLPEGSLVVGILGRLSPVKGHKYFMQAAEYVVRQIPRAIFIICGEDAQISGSELRVMSEKMRLKESFRFLSKVEDVREVVSLFNVGVVSSVGSETICRVALEYMSMGKPVVGTKVNAIPEVVEHGFNGFLVEPENAQQMANALIELLKDGEKRKIFGEASRGIVLEKFTLDLFAQKTEEVYFSLLS
jgi:glycosyltransferase involved in cell wall biosynthesis